MKPQLYQVDAFDANKDHDFIFKWEGNQSFGNILSISINKTNELVYAQSQTTMQLKHDLPAKTLKNGTLYYATVSSIDSNIQISEESNPVLFYCYSTPSFMFNNIGNNQIIQNSAYNVSLVYSQIEGELLQSYEIILYDMSKNIIQSSGVKYNSTNMNFTISSLEDNQSYYLRATGLTLNGMRIETDWIYFTVNYVQPSVYSILTLENIPENGFIKLQSNVRAIECHTNKDPIFIDDEYIDLHNDTLTIDKDFSLNNDFVINLSGYDISDGLIMQLSNSKNNIFVYKRKGTFEINNNKEKTYVELIIPCGKTYYVCRSGYFDNPYSFKKISIWIKKENGVFQISVKVGG